MTKSNDNPDYSILPPQRCNIDIHYWCVGPCNCTREQECLGPCYSCSDGNDQINGGRACDCGKVHTSDEYDELVARVEEIATQQSLYQSHYKVLGERLAEHTQLLRARQQDFSDLLDAYEDFMVSQGQRPEGNIDAGQLKITDRDFFHLHASPKWREQLSNAHRQAHAARRQEEETRASFDMVSYKRQGLMVERREAAYRRDIALNPYLTPEKR